MNTSRLFADQQFSGPVLKDMSIGAPRRDFEDLQTNRDVGSFARKFSDPKASGMPERQALSRPGNVEMPNRAAKDVMADYAHGLVGTLIVEEPVWNANLTLMGQPQIPVRPLDMCPTDLSSHYKMGQMEY